MKTHRGYFSLIQYCPDASRLEAANVGIVLLCPELSFLEARTAHGNDRVRRFFGRDTFNPASLRDAKMALEGRLTVERDHIRSLEQFQHFISTRANELKLTAPRPMKVVDPANDLDALFTELVGGRANRRIQDGTTDETIAPEPSPLHTLRNAFKQLAEAGRARLDFPVSVPIAGVQLKVPYAFRNGVWNLVKPQRFSGSEGQVIGTALKLGAEGELLERHGEDTDGKKKLIIVSSFDPEAPKSTSTRVAQILNEFKVRDVAEIAIPQFIEEVEQVAH